jgi:uncharacterized membrane protein YfbV (UPF0208 family)|tara:strand:- start:257 stop:553 length:297 start_codon:yes stop_codon:yes gene_type:complete
MKLLKQVQFWNWAGKVLPMIALMALCLVLVFDMTSVKEIVISVIAVVFGSIAFTWWWWVMGAVKSLTELLSNAQTKFTEVIGEIKDLRKDINDQNKKK